MEFARRMGPLSQSIFAQLIDQRRELESQGREIVDLSIGTPNIPPPMQVREEMAAQVLKAENYIYAIKDLPELQQAACAWYARRYGVDLDPGSEVTSLLGSQDGLAHLCLTLLNPGDTVLVPDPCYPIFSIGPAIAEANIVYMPQKKENGFLIDLTAIPKDVAKAAKLMIVSYPNNPTTAMAPPEFYKALVAFAQKYDIVVLHDNAYSELVFDGKKGGSFLQYPGAKEVGLEFNSLSKCLGMAGARVGFALGNADVVGSLKCLKSHIDYGMFLPVQRAAIAALNAPYACIQATADTYCRRRDVLIDGLEAIGWHIPKSAATMFCWAPLPGSWTDSNAFALELMRRTGVIMVPGTSFGPSGEGHLRIALVQDADVIQKAIRDIDACGIVRE